MTANIRHFFLGILGLCVSSTATFAQAPASPTKPAGAALTSPLIGEYTIVSGEKNGEAIPVERIKGSKVIFTASTVTGTDKDKKEFFAAAYVMDIRVKPWKIRMKSTAPKAGADGRGLVKTEGDTLTIIYALPGGDVPTEFKTKENQHLFVLKRTDGTTPSTKILVPGGTE